MSRAGHGEHRPGLHKVITGFGEKGLQSITASAPARGWRARLFPALPRGSLLPRLPERWHNLWGTWQVLFNLAH